MGLPKGSPFAGDPDECGVAASSRAPRPRSRPGAKRVSLSSNGRPGTRQGVRTPHLRAAMPVDAYSLAVSCGDRGVSSDIWPTSLVRHAPRRALPGSGTTGISPSRAMRRTTTVRRTPVSPALRVSAPCGFLAVGGAAPIRALPRIWRTVPCDASTAYAAASRLGTGSSPRVTPSRRALSSRPRRAWRQLTRGTLAPRHHAGTNFLLTETHAASGPEAASTPRHYRISPTNTTRSANYDRVCCFRSPVVTGRSVQVTRSLLALNR